MTTIKKSLTVPKHFLFLLSLKISDNLSMLTKATT
jgi:hypothetical protein